MKAGKLNLDQIDDVIKFSEDNEKLIHTKTYEMLNYVWQKKHKQVDVDLFIVLLKRDPDLTEVSLTVYKNEWEKALELGIKYFETQEEYEMCSQIMELLTTIK
jgi:hypothetical protein